MNKIAPMRVALVEDDVDFQAAFCDAVAASPDWEMAGLASTLSGGLALLRLGAADVLVVDLGLPDGSGIELIRSAQKAWPTCSIMVATMFADEAHVMRSLEAGADGYLLKDASAANMMREIRSVHAGGSPISPIIARQILLRFRQTNLAVITPDGPDSAPQLSARESEVLNLITKGFTSDEIAKLISVSRHTVPTYVRRIYRKLKVNSKAEAIYEAHKQGIL